jgi:serine protease AprX
MQKLVALALIFLLTAIPASAGLTITGSNGIATTGADGVSFINLNGIATTGADGILTLTPNGIATTGADGIATTGADGIATTGADGVLFTGVNGIATTGADGIATTGADNVVLTGVNGLLVTAADGTVYHPDAMTVIEGNGIATTGADGALFRGVDGIATTGADGFTAEHADGITVTGADTYQQTNAASVTLTMPDGSMQTIAPNGIATTGADSIVFTGTDGIATTGADGIATTGADGIATTGADGLTGLQSVDPELALKLDQLTDDSNVMAAVVYHHLPTNTDLADLLALGVTGGTRYHALPVILTTTTKANLIAVSHLPAVRSIYGNRTLQWNSDPYLALNNSARVPVDQDLTARNQGLPLTGQNVTVAVLDTGVDGTHADLAGRMVQNVKLLDTQGLPVGFNYPINLENLPTTDLVQGHGTFVAGVIAGNGARSAGRYAGIAPGARILGLSAGDVNLSFVLAGFDYLLTEGPSYHVRAVNCSFSASTVFDFNDPVNVATKLLTEQGINVVFSAGNTGPGAYTLNPYAVAPWVISVGATDQNGRLASFSSRGAFGSPLFHPTLVAPGASAISLRATGVNLTGLLGVVGADTSRLSLGDLPYYTTASGTSFSAPQVTGTIALMLQANPGLTPAQVRQLLQRTATPMPDYFAYEVGAGMLNAHAATLAAAFPDRHIGQWRAAADRGAVKFVRSPLQSFSGNAMPLFTTDIPVSVPANAIYTSVSIGWGPMLSLNNLALSLKDPGGVQRAASDGLNLPGLGGKHEGVSVENPAAGTWHVRVKHSFPLFASPQSFTGFFEYGYALYAPMDDLAALSAPDRAAVLSATRMLLVAPWGRKFRPSFGVSRGDLAGSLVAAGGIPQYVAAQPRFTDVPDATTRNFVETAQFGGADALFPDAAGDLFHPNDHADRLTATVALVRAAGLRSEAEARAGATLSLGDAGSIPSALRGYVAVALERGLIRTNGNSFNPQAQFTRLDLARAVCALQAVRGQ